MRYFLDTEFIEDGKTIDLISIALVAEDGRELHLCNRDCDFSKADSWVWENVLGPMGIDQPNVFPEPYAWLSHKDIGPAVLKFIGDDPKPEFWAYYADYDWVAFAQLFGRMSDLPRQFPMFCLDLKQWARYLGKEEDLSKHPPVQEHDALADARWVKAMHYLLTIIHLHGQDK